MTTQSRTRYQVAIKLSVDYNNGRQIFMIRHLTLSHSLNPNDEQKSIHVYTCLVLARVWRGNFVELDGLRYIFK